MTTILPSQCEKLIYFSFHLVELVRKYMVLGSRGGENSFRDAVRLRGRGEEEKTDCIRRVVDTWTRAFNREARQQQTRLAVAAAEC